MSLDNGDLRDSTVFVDSMLVYLDSMPWIERYLFDDWVGLVNPHAWSTWLERNRPSPLKFSPRRRNINCVKNIGEVSLVLGVDIWMPEVMGLAEMVLIGLARGHRFHPKSLKYWLWNTWSKALKYTPSIKTLSWGWFYFKFRLETNAYWVLRKNWSIDSTPIVIKKWYPMFDVNWEQVDLAPICVRLPSLFMEFWMKKGFMELGKFLGSLLDTYMSFLDIGDMEVASILVSQNLHEGLLGELNLISVEKSLNQILDYEKVPFLCTRCHQYGNIANSYSLPIQGR